MHLGAKRLRQGCGKGQKCGKSAAKSAAKIDLDLLFWILMEEKILYFFRKSY
nr:MAG TPA: hypothetical protein [Caudoviricetes sp.]